MYIPSVLTNRSGVDQREDLDSFMLATFRTIVIGPVNDEAERIISAEIEWLKQQSDEPITVVINSPGGSVYSGMAIRDMLRLSGLEIRTYCRGLAASMGAFLLATAASPGQRYITPESFVMIHQPLGGISGQATDIGIVADHINNVKSRLVDILAEHTNQKYSKVLADCERDVWMTAQQALKYGLVDHIATTLPHCLPEH